MVDKLVRASLQLTSIGKKIQGELTQSGINMALELLYWDFHVIFYIPCWRWSNVNSGHVSTEIYLQGQQPWIHVTFREKFYPQTSLKEDKTSYHLEITEPSISCMKFTYAQQIKSKFCWISEL